MTDAKDPVLKKGNSRFIVHLWAVPKSKQSLGAAEPVKQKRF